MPIFHGSSSLEPFTKLASQVITAWVPGEVLGFRVAEQPSPIQLQRCCNPERRQRIPSLAGIAIAGEK